MPSPEGYRKALRLMKMAERFHLPVMVFIDSAGAYPGVGAEERGQAEAIARNIIEMSHLKTPIICVITGEGCSGGALGIGVGIVLICWNTVLMRRYLQKVVPLFYGKIPRRHKLQRSNGNDRSTVKRVRYYRYHYF